MWGDTYVTSQTLLLPPKQYKHVKVAAQKAVSKQSMKLVAYIKIQSREVSDGLLCVWRSAVLQILLT